MKNCLVNKQILNIFLLITLVAFLILPKISLAEEFKEITPEDVEKHLTLSEQDAKNLLQTLTQVFTTEWINLEASGYSTAEENAVPVILREVVRIDILNHLLIDAPVEITGKIIKSAIEIARLILAQDISSVLEKFEKESVQRAVEYGMNFLFQNEIRVTPGAIKFEYTSCQEVKKEAIFQYLIIYKPLDAKSGKVEIRFYSPNPIEPPKVKGGIWGGTWGIYHELQHDLPPFVVEIQGTVEKTDLGSYRWVKEPLVKIDFSGPVPDLGIKPLTFWERQIWNPIITQIKDIEVIITKVTGKSPKIVENLLKIPKTAINIWNEIKSTFSKINPFGPAALVETPLPKKEEPSVEVGQEIGQEIFPSVEVKPQQPQQPEPKQLTLEEIQEILDDIAERIDVISVDVAKLTGKEIVDGEKETLVKEKIKEAEIEKPKESEEEIGQEEVGQEVVAKLCEKIPGSYPVRNRVIINEVAWMGTSNSADDEWVELKNISGTEINLAGWQLLDKNNQIKIFFNNQPRVLIKGFFLLERTNDDSVPYIPADLIYSGGLNNTNETLYLFDENCQLQDEVLANPNWPAGDNSSKRTMERKSDLTWQTSTEPGGTPKMENSGGYYVYQGGSSGVSSSPLSSDTEPPIANAGPDQTIIINEPITFDASGSSDNVGITSYRWDIDNNDGLNWDNPDLTGQKPTFNRGYLNPGTYIVTLRVSDKAGNKATDTLIITIAPPPKILITEIQIERETAKQDFIELYNPNNFDVYLKDYRLVKRAQNSSGDTTIKSWSRESEAKILSQSYYLWAGSEDKNYPSLIGANTSTTQNISSNNGIALRYGKENIGEIIDAVGGGNFNNLLFEKLAFSENPKTQDPIGDWLKEIGFKGSREPDPRFIYYQSLGRKIKESGKYQDENDNSKDFELQTPTPGAKNKSFEMPELEDIFKEVDSTPPQITISGPANPTNQTKATFYFWANEENCSFKCQLDNSSLEDCRSPKIYENKDLKDGQHTFLVKARDLFLNESSAQYTWTINTNIESPTITLFDLNTNSQFYTNQNQVGVLIFVSGNEEGISWFLSEENTTPTIDGTNWLAPKPTTYEFSTPTQDGLKTVYIWTKDLTQNISQLGNSASIILDTAPPTSQITDLENWQTSTTFTISWSGSDLTSGVADYTLQYTTSISDGIWLDLEKETEKTSFEFSGQDGMSYYFRVKAKDRAQNEGSWSDIVSTTVDTTSPLVNFDYLSSPQIQLSFTLSWSAIDPTEGVTASGIDGFYLQYTVTPSDIDGISLQYQDDEGNRQDWKEGEEGELTLDSQKNNLNIFGEDEKTYNFKIQAKDKAGNESEWFEKSTKIEIPKDTTPPAIKSFSISPSDIPLSQLNFSLSWSAIDPIKEGEPKSGIDIFYLTVTPAIDGIEYWELDKDQNQIDLSGEDGKEYYFTLKAKDKAGNESELAQISTKISLPVLSRTVVINEIAWMGTKTSSSDEWIELYNNTEEDINLEGWKIIAKDGSSEIEIKRKKESDPPIVIAKKSYFLLERTNDNTISNIPADYIYTGSLENSGEELELRDNGGNLIDFVSCFKKEDGACKNWFAGENKNLGTSDNPTWLRISMERISATTTGAISTNWHSNNLITRNGYDAGSPPNKINGTPKSENSVSKLETEIFGSLPFDEGFNEITLTYHGSPYIIKSNLIIPAPSTLTIEPGVVIKFDSQGKFSINGKILAQATSSKEIIFTSLNNSLYYGSIEFSSSSRDSIFEFCQLKNLNAIFISGSNLKFENSKFKDIAAGIRISRGSKAEFFENLFENVNFSKSFPGSILVDNSYPIFKENNGTSTVLSAIYVFGNLIDNWQMFKNENLPYIIGTNSLTISSGKVLKIDPGVETNFETTGSGVNVVRANLIINGTIIAKGTDNEKILFTSLCKDNPSNCNWGKIHLTQSSSNSIFKNAIIENGSYTTPTVIVENTLAQFENVEFRKNNSALFLLNSDSTVLNCKFEDNSLAIKIFGGTPIIQDSNFATGSRAIEIEDSFAQIKKNSFQNFVNVSGTILVKNGYPVSEDNSFSNNTRNFILLTGTVNQDWLLKSNSPYYTNGLSIAQDKKLEIEPGTILRFSEGASLIINGVLKAEGTQDNKITFTSLYDDGNSTITYSYYWKTIRFTSQNSTSSLKYVIVSYGGISDNQRQIGGIGAIRIENAKVELRNLSFKNNASPHLYFINSPQSLIADSEFDVSQTAAIKIEGESPIIQNLQFKP